MKAMKVPVNSVLLDGNEKKYLDECIRDGWISSEGPFVGRFEEQFAAKVGRKFGVAVSNGTAALELAVAALGIGPGDEVIIPSFTIISCAAAVVRAGATPVCVDCDPLTWNMRAADVEPRITSRTKAIMVVHIYGLPVDMDPILEIARARGLLIIEDAAEMHGQTYRGRPCGSFGQISTFSFYPNKHVTTGEGGMVVVDDPALAERCRSLRNLCFRKERRFIHDEFGWNMRMTNLQAALGVAQLERLDACVARKRAIGARYNQLLARLDCVERQPARTDYAENIYWVYGMVLKAGVKADAAGIMQALEKRGVGTRPFFYPMHRQPVLLRRGLCQGMTLPVSERIAERGFYVPSGVGLSEREIEYVAHALSDVLAAHV
jgi:perosamine synthetase